MYTHRSSLLLLLPQYFFFFSLYSSCFSLRTDIENDESCSTGVHAHSGITLDNINWNQMAKKKKIKKKNFFFFSINFFLFSSSGKKKKLTRHYMSTEMKMLLIYWMLVFMYIRMRAKWR